VLVVEAADSIGGGTRTAELTLPGFQHDVCSAIHPLGLASPFLKQLPLHEFGLEWIFPEASAAHPLDGGDAVMVYRDVARTAAELGLDAARYRRVIGGMSNRHEKLMQDYLAPLKLPRHPVTFSLFGMMAILPATVFSKLMFRDARTRAMFAGMAAHSIQPLERPATAAFGLMLLLLAHAVGWPMAKGGSHQITLSMGRYFESPRGDPTILKREAETELLVMDGHTAVIGGIFTRNTGRNHDQVPFFGDIPLLGIFFQQRSSSDSRGELVIFLTPRIVNRAEALGR
jgi:phytoene dehydrogenase-like protein